MLGHGQGVQAIARSLVHLFFRKGADPILRLAGIMPLESFHSFKWLNKDSNKIFGCLVKMITLPKVNKRNHFVFQSDF